MELKSLLGFEKGVSAAIIGCGGKTSLMYRLANDYRKSSVLIGTTTRILVPPANMCDHSVTPGETIRKKRGITLAYHGEESGKLMPYPICELDRIRHFFDYTVLECDGSKSLPLKGWSSNEPVVPDFVDMTIGVAVVWPTGEVLSCDNTHRLREFCKITGAKSGDIITCSHIAMMISHPSGMMQKAVGKRVLMFNQIEDETAENTALKIIDEMPKSFIQSLSLIITGSVRQNTFKIVWKA